MKSEVAAPVEQAAAAEKAAAAEEPLGAGEEAAAAEVAEATEADTDPSLPSPLAAEEPDSPVHLSELGSPVADQHELEEQLEFAEMKKIDLEEQLATLDAAIEQAAEDLGNRDADIAVAMEKQAMLLQRLQLQRLELDAAIEQRADIAEEKQASEVMQQRVKDWGALS